MKFPGKRDWDTLVIANEMIRFSDSLITIAVWPAFWNTFRLSQEVEFKKSGLVILSRGI